MTKKQTKTHNPRKCPHNRGWRIEYYPNGRKQSQGSFCNLCGIDSRALTVLNKGLA